MMDKEVVTLFDKPMEELTHNELKREFWCQRFLLKWAKKQKMRFEYLEDNSPKNSIMRQDKIDFCENLIKALDGKCTAIAHEIQSTPKVPGQPFTKMSAKRRAALRRKRKEMHKEENFQKALFIKNRRDGIAVSWDCERFMLICRDRGYQTEEAVIHAVGKELKLDYGKAEMALRLGRFSWGQVLCLGAMLEMTPKEFCDVFLAGYFVEQFGNYVASYRNIDRTELLKLAVRPKPLIDQSYETAEERQNRLIEELIAQAEEVTVDASGKPEDEIIWFDE